MDYLAFKAIHIFTVISWFAGLFYLPRIYVNLAMVPPESEAEYQRLLVMSQKLYRFVTPIAVIALCSGWWVWLVLGIGGTWMNIKFFLVILLVGYHHACHRLLRRFEQKANCHSHIWYRWFNEVPAVILLLVTWLAVFKPFGAS